MRIANNPESIALLISVLVLLGPPHPRPNRRHHLRRDGRQPFHRQLRHVLRRLRDAVAVLPHPSFVYGLSRVWWPRAVGIGCVEYAVLVLWCGGYGCGVGGAFLQ